MSGDIGKVGKKGELFPPKFLREKLGFTPDSKIRYSISPKGYLIVEKIYSVSELLNQKSIAFVEAEEIESLSEKMQNNVGNEENENFS